MVRQNLVVFHAFFGCDTTSGFFAHPFHNALTMQWDHLAKEFEIFRDSNATIRDVHEAGLKLMAALYGCAIDLNQERVTLFRDLINLIQSM